MKDLIQRLIQLQEVDSRILHKLSFINKVPMRISEVDEPLKKARLELEQSSQKSDNLAKKKLDNEKRLEEINEKIRKMKVRVSEIKTNKEYQAHLKEIESSEKGISTIEEEILTVMEELDVFLKQKRENEGRLNAEIEKMNAFKKALDLEVQEQEQELAVIRDERSKLVQGIDPDVYSTYMKLMDLGTGVAVTKAQNEICLGCDMHIPPQLFVEIRKNEEIHQCPQCRRILYYIDETIH